MARSPYLPALEGEDPEIRPMNERMKLFVEEYCTGAQSGRPFNRTQAARVAGYTNPQNTGTRLMKDPRVAAAVDKRLDEVSMRSTEIVARLTQIATGEVGSILEIQTDIEGNQRLTIDPEKVMEMKHLISKFGYDSNGLPKIEFHDAHTALRDLGRVRHLFGDSNELSGPGGGPIPVTMTLNFVRPGDPQSPQPELPAEVIPEGEYFDDDEPES